MRDSDLKRNFIFLNNEVIEEQLVWVSEQGYNLQYSISFSSKVCNLYKFCVLWIL